MLKLGSMYAFNILFGSNSVSIIKPTEAVTINGLASGIGYCEYYDFGTDEFHTFDLIFLNPSVTVNGNTPSWTPTGKNM